MWQGLQIREHKQYSEMQKMWGKWWSKNREKCNEVQKINRRMFSQVQKKKKKKEGKYNRVQNKIHKWTCVNKISLISLGWSTLYMCHGSLTKQVQPQCFTIPRIDHFALFAHDD